MSGPYCETCKHFNQYPRFGNGESRGRCTDPAKIIYRSGSRVAGSCIEVLGAFECSNHAVDENPLDTQTNAR